MSLLHADVRLARGGRRLEAEFSIEPGVTALFGPSGAGKTTLLHVLAGLLRPDAGRIVLAGDVLFDGTAGTFVPPERRRVGVVFQDLRLFPHLDVRSNLHYGRRGPGAGAPDAGAVIDLLELGPLLSRRPATLSGGEARRVAIGRALLAGPRLLLLDEPLAGLDEARRQNVLGLLDRVRTGIDVPMLFVSHSLPDILQLTNRMIVLSDGRTIGQGDLHDVLGREPVFRLADSLGLESLLEVRIQGPDAAGGLTRATLGEATVSLPPVDRPAGTRALVAVRPEDVILARAPVEGTSVQNALPGVVTRVSRLSDRLLVTVDVGGPLRAEISARAAEELGVREGARLHCLVKAFAFRWRRFPEDPA